MWGNHNLMTTYHEECASVIRDSSPISDEECLAEFEKELRELRDPQFSDDDLQLPSWVTRAQAIEDVERRIALLKGEEPPSPRDLADSVARQEQQNLRLLLNCGVVLLTAGASGALASGMPGGITPRLMVVVFLACLGGAFATDAVKELARRYM